jgi:hypothetical protein
MSIEAITDYLGSLSLHDRETLLHILEVADKAMLLDCSERKIFDGLKLSLWKSIKIEEIK